MCLRGEDKHGGYLQLEDSISTARSDHLTIRTPVDRKHLVCMARQIDVQLFGGKVPDFESGISATADEQAAVGGEAYLVHRLHVAA